MKTISTTLGVLTLAMLGACGGGGSSSSDGGAVTGQPLVVTTANYQTVAVESASVVNDMVASSSIAGLVGVRGSVASSVVPVIVRNLPGWIAKARAGQPVLVGVVQSADIPCTTGSMNVSLNDANSNGNPDFGESIGVTFNNCGESGSTLSGSMTMVFNTQPIGLGSSTGSLDVTVAMTNVDMVDATSHLHANGSMRVATTRTAIDTGFDTITTAAFTESNTVGGVSSTRSLKDFSSRTDLLAGQATTNYSGTLTSSALGGNSVIFSSTTAFVTLPNALYPSAGAARAVGASSGAVILTALNATTVRVDLDANGDGTPETTTTLPWTSLF